MFFTANQLVAHAIGDYLLQSHWMATEKVKKSFACLVHVMLYTLPFLLLTRSVAALAVIVGTHFVIDRWRLARYVVWAKNQLAPAGRRVNQTATGYPDDTPPFLSVWLLIIADNTIHIICNATALHYL